MINRAPYNGLVDDDGTNLVGSIWNKAAIASTLLDPIDAAIATVVLQNPTGTLHNFTVPGRTGVTFWQWAGGSTLVLSGIAGGVIGDRLTIRNVCAAASGIVMTFAHLGAGSLAANQFYNFATSAPTPVAPGGSATFVYNGSTWVLVHHEQGAPLAAPVSGAAYAGSGAMTVAVTGTVTGAYTLRGKTLELAFHLNGVTLGGTANNAIIVNNAAFGGFSTALPAQATQGLCSDPSAVNYGQVMTVAAGPNLGAAATELRLMKVGAANWALGVAYLFSFTLGVPVL